MKRSDFKMGLREMAFLKAGMEMKESSLSSFCREFQRVGAAERKAEKPEDYLDLGIDSRMREEDRVL